MLEEKELTSKVEELMKALDQVKKYKELSRSLKHFLLIAGGSILLYIVARVILEISQSLIGLNELYFYVFSLLELLIPLVGIVAGIFYVKHKVDVVQVEQWKPALAQGASGALKILSEMNWENTFDEISSGRLAAILYGFLKVGVYWVLAFLAFSLFGDLFFIHFFHRTVLFAGVLWGTVSLVVVLLVQSRDLFERYTDARSLDFLLWELRWFDSEFRRAKFAKA